MPPFLLSICVHCTLLSDSVKLCAYKITMLAYNERMITSKQCKMARAALNWSIRDLADKANVDKATVSRFENGKDSYASTAAKLRAALESSGKITFNSNTCVCVKENA